MHDIAQADDQDRGHGYRGRAPAPASVAKLRGYFRESRHGNRPEPPPGKVGAPSTLLDEVAQRIWSETVDASPWLRQADEPLLSLYCESIARWRQAVVQLTEAQGLQPEAYEPKELASFRLQVRVAAKDVRENARALAIPPNVRARLQTEQPTEAQRFGFVLNSRRACCLD